MEAKVEEDLRRQVASLNHKLDSTLQGGDTQKKKLLKKTNYGIFRWNFFCGRHTQLELGSAENLRSSARSTFLFVIPKSILKKLLDYTQRWRITSCD